TEGAGNQLAVAGSTTTAPTRGPITARSPARRGRRADLRTCVSVPSGRSRVEPPLGEVSTKPRPAAVTAGRPRTSPVADPGGPAILQASRQPDPRCPQYLHTVSRSPCSSASYADTVPCRITVRALSRAGLGARLALGLRLGPVLGLGGRVGAS